MERTERMEREGTERTERLEREGRERTERLEREGTEREREKKEGNVFAFFERNENGFLILRTIFV
jgi:hypothetical protein